MTPSPQVLIYRPYPRPSLYIPRPTTNLQHSITSGAQRHVYPEQIGRVVGSGELGYRRKPARHQDDVQKGFHRSDHGGPGPQGDGEGPRELSIGHSGDPPTPPLSLFPPPPHTHTLVTPPPPCLIPIETFPPSSVSSLLLLHDRYMTDIQHVTQLTFCNRNLTCLHPFMPHPCLLHSSIHSCLIHASSMPPP